MKRALLSFKENTLVRRGLPCVVGGVNSLVIKYLDEEKCCVIGQIAQHFSFFVRTIFNLFY